MLQKYMVEIKTFEVLHKFIINKLKKFFIKKLFNLWFYNYQIIQVYLYWDHTILRLVLNSPPSDDDTVCQNGHDGFITLTNYQ